MTSRGNIPVPAVFALYCLSGLVSLGYQIVWFRFYTDRFGSTSLTFLVVLTSFIAGLGVGAIASRRICRWLTAKLQISDGLRLYGTLEVLIACLATLSAISGLVSADVFGPFPYELDGAMYVPTLGLRLGQTGVAVLCVFLPTLLMGVTFPLLCQIGAERERFPSRLYAWNTLGACSGVLICQFVLIYSIGHLWTFWALVALNLVVGGFFLRRGGAPLPRFDAEVGKDDRKSLPSSTGGSDNSVARRQVAQLVILAAASGLLTGSLEGDLFKRLWFLGTNSGAAMAFISFWAILGIYLASVTVTRLAWLTLTHLKLAVAAACLVYIGLWKSAYAIRGWFRDIYADRLFDTGAVSASTSNVVPSALQTDVFFTFVFVGIFTFPVVFFISLILPFVCNAARGNQRLLGLVYGVNTIAFCVGMVGFIWLAPRVDIFYSLKLALVALFIGAVTLCFVGNRTRRSYTAVGLGVAAFVAAAVLTPRGYDRGALDPARQVYHYPVRSLKSNGAHTTYVVEMPAGDWLYFDSHPMSATDLEAQIYMRLMAHFPLMAQRDAKSALLIGFGVGNTASAIAQHDSIERLDVVDLNRKVIETAPEFKDTNNAVYLDERVRVIIDDGRQFLNRTDQRYDLITSEPPPPLQDGVYRLYSKEYYETALSRLTPEGMLTQWLPISQLSNATTELMISTFASVFPETVLFSGYGAQLILVGARTPIDLALLHERVSTDVEMVAELRRLRMPTPQQFFARILKPDFVIDREYGGLPVISDQRNDLAFQVAASLNLTRLSFNPYDTQRWFETVEPSGGSFPTDGPAHLGRILYQLPDFPVNWLDIEVEANDPQVALAGVDWSEVVRLFDAYQLASRTGDHHAAQAHLQSCLDIAAEQPLVLLELGRTQRALGEHEQAARTFQRFLAVEPREALGFLSLGDALIATGEPRQAIQAAQHAIELQPNSPWGYRQRGQVLRDMGELVAALEDYNRAIEIAPDEIAFIKERAAVIARLQGTIEQ